MTPLARLLPAKVVPVPVVNAPCTPEAKLAEVWPGLRKTMDPEPGPALAEGTPPGNSRTSTPG